MSAINSSTAPESEQPSPPPHHKSQRYPALAALRHRDFRLLWLGQIVSVTGSQMQLVAISWHVWLLTRSALALGLIGLFRGGPIIVCSLLGGVVADTVDRRRLMMATQSVMLVSAAGLMTVTIAGLRHVWPIYLLTAVAASASAFDTPARQALMPRLVPKRDFPNAVSISLIVFQISMIAGPSLAGFILASHGPAIVYGANALSFLAVIFALIAMHTSGQPDVAETKTTVSWAAMREGLGFVRRSPVIVQTMTLDFAATFFASASALLPIFADKVLNVGAHGYGFLAAAPATGAILTGVVMARIGTFRRQGKLVIVSVAIFGLATIGFGVSRIFWLSLLMLALTGASDTVSTVLRQTIRQLSTPDHLRGRMTSVNMVFFMGGPQLGELEAGAVAALIGAPLSVVIGGIGSFAAAIIAFARANGLKNYDN
jgi:MFS family permease